MQLVVAGRHQDGFALAYIYAIDVGLSSHAEDNDERINLVIDIHGLVHHHTINIEIGAMHQWRIEKSTVVGAAIFGINVIVDGILRLFDVEFAGIAVGVTTTIVIDAIGDVAGLLYFGNEIASTDGVKASCGQEIDIALMRFVCSDDIQQP